MTCERHTRALARTDWCFRRGKRRYNEEDRFSPPHKSNTPRRLPVLSRRGREQVFEGMASLVHLTGHARRTRVMTSVLAPRALVGSPLAVHVVTEVEDGLLAVGADGGVQELLHRPTPLPHLVTAGARVSTRDSAYAHVSTRTPHRRGYSGRGRHPQREGGGVWGLAARTERTSSMMP